MKVEFQAWMTAAFIICTVSSIFVGVADGADELVMWKCADLLDAGAKSDLLKQERVFADLFKSPRNWDRLSEEEKNRLTEQWIQTLEKGKGEEVAKAAASLGMAKSREATQPLMKLIDSGKGGGRARWVSARALGQIGDKESVPFLINLLDNQNWNTRFYAMVSLTEIAGVYYGEDKSKWTAWQNGKTPLRCTPESCDIPAEDSGDRISSDKLNFRLRDSYGRVIDSVDYEGVPVLVMSGSCWCGGCQQDSELLREISHEYGPHGLAVVRTVAGDNELAALDFQKHYRLSFPQVMDTNRTVEKKYNRAGWTFLMLADRTGKVVYKANVSGDKDWQTLKEKLNDVLTGVVSGKMVTRDGVAYMSATLERSDETEKGSICERFPSIACGPGGKVCIVFTSSGGTSDDVFARFFDGETWSGNIPIAATDADEYDGTVLFGEQGRIWACWTSGAGGENYDIFVKSFTDPCEQDGPIRITHSDDDAMHGRMVCDRDRRIWLTYYKWRKMRGRSRDREIYIRRLGDSGGSDEIQISPTDVPEYEDHTDPSIAAAGNSVVVAWSWDFHPPNRGYSKYAELPTIFMRTVRSTMGLGETSSVSGKDIDSTPAVAISKDRRIWCAWDRIDRSQHKTVYVANPKNGADTALGKMKPLSDTVLNVCSTCFAESSNGDLTALWCETADGRNWRLKKSNLLEQGEWAKPETIVSKDNPRYCCGAYDEQDRLWVCYTIETQRGREIVVMAVDDNNGIVPKT